MPAALLTAALAAPIHLLRRLGRPAAVARLSTGDVGAYAAGIACMLRARLWTLLHAEPRWPALHRAWAAAEGNRGVREALAGRLHDDDRLALIADGLAAFARRDAMYADARRSIDIASYYLQCDATGRATVASLAAAVRRGVRVRLLVDRVMTFKKSHEGPGLPALLTQARDAGIELRQWHDARRPFDSNHRKMIVVDRRQALVGGRNFADHYRGNDWRDVDLDLQGPTAAALAEVFDAVWAGAAEGDDGPHPVAPWQDHVPAAIAADPMMRFVLAAVGVATERVDLELAYLVAHEPLCGALARAARRGVKVRVLTNSAESNDLPFATWTADEAMRRLLEAGCELHLRRGAGRTLHSKYLLVDAQWVSFGSHNLDYFSPRYCCETNLVVRDERLAALLLGFFDDGWAEAAPTDLAEVLSGQRQRRAQRMFDRVFRDFQ